MKWAARVGWMCLVAVPLIGCGGGGDDAEKGRPARTKVSGVVTFKGAPLEGATVALSPMQPGGNGAVGITDAQGKFQLGTFDKADGAVPGEYQVKITKMTAAASAGQASMDDPNYDPNPKEEAPKSLLPAKYADFNKSGLTASIGQSEKPDLNFDLVE